MAQDDCAARCDQLARPGSREQQPSLANRLLSVLQWDGDAVDVEHELANHDKVGGVPLLAIVKESAQRIKD